MALDLARVKYLLDGMKQRHDERLVVFTEINELYRIIRELVAELELRDKNANSGITLDEHYP